ncbi:PAS domain-containing two-component system sensor histidine kinase/response regulator [Planomonospora sphaerica]|uniref:histidine kinase n=1 Tax=Planomonospora sphaerica TaxID=161355 RepID=A0A171DKP3_9ACTN|nr:ATP-binding protein [Planomonospora sphaerica]GAT69399.1 PAS domain-containing two-component system sensor histidine kinase/response regulator [Planomonospora sphaerica]
MAGTQRDAALVALFDEITSLAQASDDFEAAAHATLGSVCELIGWPLGHLWVPADLGDDFVSADIWAGSIEDFPALREVTLRTLFSPGTGTIGQVVTTGKPVWSRDVTADPLFFRAQQERDLRVRAAFAFPVVAADGVAAVLEFFSEQAAERDEPLLRMLTALGHQLGRVIDRQRVHQLVEGNRHRLRQLIETSMEAFISMDAAGRITEWNAAAERMFDRPRQEALGRLLHETIVPPRYRKAEEAGRARFLSTGRSNVLGRRLELAGWRPDGSEFPIEIVVWATREDGEWAFHSFVHDITDRRRAEQALRQAYEAEQATVTRLKELDAAKDAFIATVSHELRTPLTSLIGYLEVVSDADAGVVEASPPGRRMLDAMIRNAARLQDLVEDLLAINSINPDRLEVDAAPVPVGEIVEEAVRVTAAAARDSGHGFQVRLDAGAGHVPGDRDLLVRAVGALLSNAVRYSATGTPITVHASAAGQQVAIAVTDTGAGIDTDELPHVFERFYRTRYAHEHAIQGVGLGLTIAEAIAEAHGGTITVVSTPGEGSTFTLNLPVSAPGPDRGRPGRPGGRRTAGGVGGRTGRAGRAVPAPDPARDGHTYTRTFGVYTRTHEF